MACMPFVPLGVREPQNRKGEDYALASLGTTSL
jgi:hypothetical protein